MGKTHSFHSEEDLFIEENEDKDVNKLSEIQIENC